MKFIDMKPKYSLYYHAFNMKYYRLIEWDYNGMGLFYEVDSIKKRLSTYIVNNEVFKFSELIGVR